MVSLLVLAWMLAAKDGPLAKVTHDRTNEGKIPSLESLERGNALWGHEGWT
jgi:hypothetical protein